MSSQRDPFRNPFPVQDKDRHQIWDMLVTRDINAFVAADWSEVADDFIEAGLLGLNAHFEHDTQGYTLTVPTL